MVADGKNLWFYDRDLDQVSVKPAAAALTATPASLLSGDGKLGEFFDGARRRPARRAQLGARGHAEAQRRRLSRSAARLQGQWRELRRMVLKDKLGQTVHLVFNVSERNVPVADAEVTIHAARRRRRHRHADSLSSP